MNAMFSRLAAAGLLLAAAAGAATADIAEPRAADPLRHVLLMQRADIERNTLSHRYEWVVNRADDQLSSNPVLARQDPWLLLYRAIGLSGLGFEQEAAQECEELIARYAGAEPLAAAWAQVWIGHNHKRRENYRAAIAAFRAVEEYAPMLDDLSPVLEARHNAAEYFLRNTRFDPAHPDHPEILGFDPADKESLAWARGAICARMAYMGDYEAAATEYQRLLELVGPQDRRAAIAGIDLACSEIDGYDSGRRVMMSALVHAQQVVDTVRRAFPGEDWLNTKGKLRVALFHLSHSLDLPKAERLAREAADGDTATGLEAEAGARLVEILFQMKRYDEAASACDALHAAYPYTRWAHYAAFLKAEALNAKGDFPGYVQALDAIIAAFPETAYGEVATYTRERIMP